MGDTKTPAQSLADKYLPDIAPDVRQSWLRQYDTAPRVISVEGVDERPKAAAPPLDAALAAAARPGPAPTASPFGPPPTTSWAAPSNAAPKGGDWTGRAKDVAAIDEQRKKDNLAGATFYDPTAGGAAGPAPGMLVAPGGRTPASWATQTQQGVELSPDVLQTPEAVAKAEGTAARAQFEAEGGEGQRLKGIQNDVADKEATRGALMQQRADDLRTRMAEGYKRLDTMMADAARDHVDPGKAERDYWTKQGTAGSIAVGIAAMGLGISAGMAGRPNEGLAMIERGINGEIEAQRANASLRGRNLDQQKSILGEMTRLFGAGEAADTAAHMVYLRGVDARIAASAAQAKTEYARSKWLQAQATIREKLGQQNARLQELTQDKVMSVQHDVNAPAQYAGAGASDKHTDEQTTDLSKELEKAGVPQAYSQLKDIDRSIDTLGTGDIPGVGPIENHVPDWMEHLVGRDQAVAGRQAVASVKNQTRKAIAGASLTENEKAELDKQLEGANDAASLRRVVQAFRQSLSYRARNIFSGASDKSRAEYARRYGAIPREKGPFTVPLDQGTTPYQKPAE